mgnify:CR=1 FL=1
MVRGSCTTAAQLQVGLTIDMDVTFITPLDMLIPDIFPESPMLILDMLESFIGAASLFVTSPVSVTVCPTCPASDTFLLHTSHVFPSFVTSLNVSGLSPFCRHPVALSAFVVPRGR